MNQLHKSSKNKILFGVCGGLSENTGIDATILRFGFVIGTIFTGSILLWIYLLLAILLPSHE